MVNEGLKMTVSLSFKAKIAFAKVVTGVAISGPNHLDAGSKIPFWGRYVLL